MRALSIEVTMALVQRKILTDAHGYREVTLEYQIARAAMLDSRGVSAGTGRIACPGLDAAKRLFVWSVCFAHVTCSQRT